MNRKQLHILMEQFQGKEFTDEEVAEFCKKHKIEPVSAGKLKDMMYAEEFDTRLEEIYPKVIGVLAKINRVHEYEDPETAEKLVKENEDLAIEIAQVIEDSGMLYIETSFLQTLGKDLSMILQSAENRINNMGAMVFHEVSKKYIADPLTVKALATKHREIANEKYEEQEKKAKKAEKENNKQDTDNEQENNE